MPLPAWAGSLIELSDFGGDVEAYFTRLYEVFTADFITTPATFNGRPIIFDNRLGEKNRAECFWHVTSTEDPVDGRLPDMRRCERIEWIKQIIDNHTDPAVLKWETIRKGSVRTLLLLDEGNFLVVLANRSRNYFLTTAFYIEHASRKAKLMAEHDAYVRNGNRPVRT
jgi:hypothetical protein